MKNKKIIIIVEIIGITLGFLAIGFGLYKILTPKKEPLKYDDAVALSKQIKENKTKLEKTLKEINKNKELTKEEKIKQEIEEEKKSETFKEYEKLTEKQKEEIDAIPREEEVPMEKLDEIIEEQNTDKEIEIPSKFNLADKIKIKVEDQKNRGLCWAFASLNSIETFITLHYGENYDFSEQHINYITSNLLYGDREIDSGGDFEKTENYLAQSGVVLEKDVPYEKNYDENEYSKFIDMKPVKIITNTVDFPSIFKTAWSENIPDEELNKYRQTVKKHIMTNGSLYATISSDGNNNTATDYSYRRYYYVSKENPRGIFLANHAISIVGWDDNFPKEKFSDNGNMPEHDGAYIAINSWGNSYTDEEGNQTAYFYISYDDMFVESTLSGITSAEFDIENTINLDDIKSNSIKKYLLKQFNYAIKEYNGKEYLPKFVVDDIYEITLKNAKIDFKDLESFTNLRSLSITDSKLTSIDDLPKLENLTYLNLSNNSIENINKLAEYNNLKDIYLDNNNIKDVSSLSSMDLYRLDISNNPGITGYGSIRTMELNLNNNQLSQLEDLNPRIGNISLDNNNFESIPNNLINIGTLSIKNNKLIDLIGIDTISNLYTLDISKNNISDITQLNNLHVRNLIIKNSGIKSLDGYNPSYPLYTLDISDNKDIKNYGNIPTTVLKIDNCNIEEIENLNESIKYVYANDNSITSIDNLSNKNLDYVSINNNKTTLTGTLDFTNIHSISIVNTKIAEDITIINNEKSYVVTNDYNTYIKVFNTDTNCTLQGFELTKTMIEEITNGTIMYLNEPVLNIDVDVINNKIDITKYKELKSLYNIYMYFDEDDVIISRDRKTITVPDDLEKLVKNEEIKIGSSTFYGTININLQRKNSLLNSIANAFN